METQNPSIKIFGHHYYHGDYLDWPYLLTQSMSLAEFYVEEKYVCPPGGPVGAFLLGTGHAVTVGQSFTPYGFYMWAKYDEFATLLLGGNDRFEDTDDCSLSTYCLTPAASTGVVDCRRMEWRAIVAGGTAFASVTVYFQLEGRLIGVGAWDETCNQISTTCRLDENGAGITPWLYVSLNRTGYEYRFVRVNFTSVPCGP